MFHFPPTHRKESREISKPQILRIRQPTLSLYSSENGAPELWDLLSFTPYDTSLSLKLICSLSKRKLIPCLQAWLPHKMQDVLFAGLAIYPRSLTALGKKAPYPGRLLPSPSLCQTAVSPPSIVPNLLNFLHSICHHLKSDCIFFLFSVLPSSHQDENPTKL